MPQWLHCRMAMVGLEIAGLICFTFVLAILLHPVAYGSSESLPAARHCSELGTSAPLGSSYAILKVMNHDPTLLAVVGPTASGKSHLALELASRFGGEILNCDSLQMFRWFDLGTAKLPPAERRGVPHHFMDILNPDEQFAAGDYMRQGRAVMREVSARGRLPIVAGGTGFYLRALIDGLTPSPSRDEPLRQRLQARANQRASQGEGEYLHRLLWRIDRTTAATIHANDTPKLIRAIEVCLLGRRPASELFSEGRATLTGFRVLRLGIDAPREALYGRINLRTAAMFDKGLREPALLGPNLLEEVQSIIARGYAATLPPFQAHGYRQAVDHLEGRITLPEALYHAQTRTRQYAKRQMTWFRKEPAVHWLRGFGSDPAVIEQAIALVADFIGKT